ncbi:uncharacterized protein PGTG_16575 [Puccinia graminis f. sp. tritici CRL 75-36-700-3]|uniref:Uncharacterized protein n=2 Tax=Puccinia graminis f. sp. tritici TaxID=56615 RepID=E3L1X4_PUCGT|nr:uncharacterized protein PGTG_16575 [Puccinia graminis f. sp. tritici CRL 75-36-700-3]EFP90549.2 hypothetical protein PGTG_16575 [Puccinia graminis f. sp. tritici CRL 75-36-700-3]
MIWKHVISKAEANQSSGTSSVVNDEAEDKEFDRILDDVFPPASKAPGDEHQNEDEYHGSEALSHAPGGEASTKSLEATPHGTEDEDNDNPVEQYLQSPSSKLTNPDNWPELIIYDSTNKAILDEKIKNIFTANSRGLRPGSTTVASK